MTIYKATPKAIVQGIRDVSRRTIPREPEQLPQHLPLFYLLTEHGPLEPQVCVGESFKQLYGDRTLDYRSPYLTHQTVLMDYVNQAGNQFMVQRVKPVNGKTAMIRLSVEYIPCEVPIYERNVADGTIKLNASGVPIQEMNGTNPVFAIGHRLVWRTTTAPWTVPAATLFAAGTTLNDFRAGTVTASGEALSTLVKANGDRVSSILIPIMDLEVADFGEHGNRKGIRLSAPNADDLSPGDTSAMNVLGSYLYRLSCVERPINDATANLVRTVAGEPYLELGFKNALYHPQSGLPVSVNERFIEAYQALNDPTIAPLYGPFGRSYVYETQLNALLAIIANGGVVVNGSSTTIGEGFYDTTAATYGRTAATAFTGQAANRHLLNLFTGVDQNGVPYWSFDVRNSVKFGGVAFGDNNVHYATGGDDGLVLDSNLKPNMLANLQLFDAAVANLAGNFGDIGSHMLDVAKYPCSTIWDSGFSMETKKKLLTPMSRRKDIWVLLSTQAVAEYDNPLVPVLNEFKYADPNTSSEETAFATILRNVALASPESFIDGTPACRAFIVGRCGKLISSEYRGYLPLTIDMAAKVAAWMGAGNGRWTSGQSIDEQQRNIVTLFRDINITYQNDTTYNAEWEAGLIWVQNYDRRSQFYPAFQSVYPDDTSVLNSLPTVAACCELERVAQAVWRDLSGNSGLTNAQFIQESNRMIVARTEGRFDNRFVIQPETFFTEADATRGFSWGTNIHIYANNMKTVSTVTIVAHRLEDLAQ